MGPLWCGQSTVPHATLSNLLSTDVLVSPPGAPVGAGEETQGVDSCAQVLINDDIPADKVLVEDMIVLVVYLGLKIATMLTLHLLPGAAENV